MFGLPSLAVYGIAAVLIVGGIFGYGQVQYWRGYNDHKAKIKAEISESIVEGTKGRNRALDDFANGRLPNSWFRD